VRTFLALLAGLAIIPSAVAARADTSSALSLSVSTHKVLYSHKVVLSGMLTGKSVAGRSITIEAWPYGDSSPHVVGTVRTDKTGMWMLRAKPGIQTSYRARLGSTMSERVVVGVAPVVSIDELANGRIRATVKSMHAFNRRFVELQTRNANGSWNTVARRHLSTASIAVFSATLPTSTIRIAMSVNQAGGGYLGAASHALAYHAAKLTMNASTTSVLFGHHVTLSGKLLNGKAHQHVTIVARPYGRTPFVFAVLTTSTNGSFSINATPSIRTTYQAQFGGTRQSQAPVVGVRPTLTVRELANGQLLTHVASAHAMKGSQVQLQQLMTGNTWQTVAKRPLLANATATFHLQARPNATLRVALSVNQAGAGYLGSWSHPLLYRAV
jgi:hypothetical protein